MVQVIYSQPNREMEAIGQGIAALGQNLFAVKKYENELADAQRQIAIEDAQRARDLEDRERRLQADAEDSAFLQSERQRLGVERTREDEERSAAQGFNAQEFGRLQGQEIGRDGRAVGQGVAPFAAAGPQGAAMAGGALGGFLARKQLESEGVKRLVEKMSPEAGRNAVRDFQENTFLEAQAEQKQILSQSMVQMRTAVRDFTQQGVMPQDTGSAIYQSLDPALLANADPQTMGLILEEVDKAEKAMNAALDQHSEDQTRAVQRAHVEADVNEELADAEKLLKRGFITREQFGDMARKGARLISGLALYTTPGQVESMLDEIRAMGRPPKQDKSEAPKPTQREALRAKLIEDLVTRGEEIPAENAWSAPGRKTYTYDEAEAIALQRIPEPRREFNFLERPVPRGTSNGAQVPTNVAASSQQAPAPERRAPDLGQSTTSAPREQAATGEAPRIPDVLKTGMRPRDEFLKGGGKPIKPESMRQAIAEAVAGRIPLASFASQIGLDLDTLTDDDLAEIERIVRSLTGGKSGG